MKKNILMAVVCCFGIVSSSHAGTIKVVNENTKDLTVRLFVEGSPSQQAMTERCCQMRGKGSCHLKTTPGQVLGATHYAIEGETNPFTSTGSCRNLRVDKDYQVTFTDDAIGTSCIARRLN
ncbi:MAG: hypothetical protein C0514_08340 [Candidatus Puniceispirillum sp.]|nr:hypothetical protein [Candidatus Puniceispirillum sp.]